MRQRLKSVEQRIANLVNVISQTGNATLVAELHRMEIEKKELLIKISNKYERRIFDLFFPHIFFDILKESHFSAIISSIYLNLTNSYARTKASPV